MTQKPKILFYDLETTPSHGYVWGKYDQTVLKFTAHRELLSVAYKWHGESKIHCETREGQKSDKALVARLHALFNEADILVAHNGDSFDAKVARARFSFHRMAPTKVLASVDTRKVARDYFSFNGNSLSDLADFFNLGAKGSVGSGIELWLACMRNEPAAWRKMERYNKQDVRLLAKLYTVLRPYMLKHPNVARILDPRGTAPACGVCGSLHVKRNGIRATVAAVKQQYMCNRCGSRFETRFSRKEAA